MALIRRPSLTVAYLAFVIAVAAWLRFDGLGAPSFWLDEILHYDIATDFRHLPWWKWIIGPDGENGSLYYLSGLAGRFLRSPEASARLAPAVFGLATVAAGWFAARKVDRQHAVAIVFVLLLAVSPLHVYYSREARPYSLLMLLATLALAGRVMIASIAAVFTAAIALPLLGATAIAYAPTRKRVAAFVAACCVVVYAAYRPATSNRNLFPGISFERIKQVLESFSASAVDTSSTHVSAYIFALAALVGAVDLFRRNREAAWIVSSLACMPVVITLAALWKTGHWFSIRYLTPALPAYLLLVACGVVTLARRAGRAVVPAALAIAAVLVTQGLPAARSEPFRKLDWRAIASVLRRRVPTGDVVLTTNDWSAVCLVFYVRNRLPQVYVINASESIDAAEKVIRDHPRVWIVTAGFHTRPEIVQWTCRYPIVMASSLEAFRLHYSRSEEAMRVGDAFIDEKSAWRGGRSRFSATIYNRVALERLVARLGFDPRAAVPKLLRGDITMEQLAETVASYAACVGDAEYIGRAYDALAGKPVSPSIERECMDLLRQGMTRSAVAVAILKRPEVQGALKKSPLRTP